MPATWQQKNLLLLLLLPSAFAEHRLLQGGASHCCPAQGSMLDTAQGSSTTLTHSLATQSITQGLSATRTPLVPAARHMGFPRSRPAAVPSQPRLRSYSRDVLLDVFQPFLTRCTPHRTHSHVCRCVAPSCLGAAAPLTCSKPCGRPSWTDTQCYHNGPAPRNTPAVACAAALVGILRSRRMYCYCYNMPRIVCSCRPPWGIFEQASCAASCHNHCVVVGLPPALTCVLSARQACLL